MNPGIYLGTIKDSFSRGFLELLSATSVFYFKPLVEVSLFFWISSWTLLPYSQQEHSRKNHQLILLVLKAQH